MNSLLAARCANLEYTRADPNQRQKPYSDLDLITSYQQSALGDVLVSVDGDVLVELLGEGADCEGADIPCGTPVAAIYNKDRSLSNTTTHQLKASTVKVTEKFSVSGLNVKTGSNV